MKTITVPGSLLLAGEYAITVEGGLGLALAVTPRLVLDLEPAPVFSFSGVAGGRPVADRGLVGALRAEAARLLGIQDSETAFPVALRADSSAFFDPDGNKIGLGSSAALAVALAEALVACHRSPNLAGPASCRALVLAVALAGHRAFQGGGSGYDVYTSFHGVVGLFRGGLVPSWEEVAGQEWFREVVLLRGASPVRSGAAVQGFRDLSEKWPDLTRRFVGCSNRGVAALARAASFRVARRAIGACRRNGLWIGRILGLEPEPEGLREEIRKARVAGLAAKASGAGGELGFAFGDDKFYVSLDGVVTGMAKEGSVWL